MEKPYIGITGFMKPEEVSEILLKVKIPENRKIMVGVLANSKTLGGLKNEKFPGRYPSLNQIYKIFPDNPQVLSLIHFNTKERDILYDQLGKLTAISGQYLHGFQLNMAWPDPYVLKMYRAKNPGVKIILQIGNHALEMVGHNPQECANRIMKYKGFVNHVLLDSSGGYGRVLDILETKRYLDVLMPTIKNMDVGIGIAGGLNPDTLHLIEPIIRNFPNVSIDAEGGLRDSNDHLKLDKAIAYLQTAIEMFEK
ncbi:MAG: hypothetical protein PHE59_04050 [Patescibacteria group bacterium]|nr:hypothetical protein [Patescibacteria group bacterium]MDD5164684.1 hypothetical protein [Patescibacteria group bacterium]MDD5534994.1 hypothetical protein [Patescibacteria group bacterium]